MDKSDDPFAPLTEVEIAAAARQRNMTDNTRAMTLICPPADAEDGEAAAARLYRRRPDAAWRYYTEDGSLAFLTLRWNEGSGKKAIRPLSWAEGEGWRLAAWPGQRPLYNLPAMLNAPAAAVVICEGEKSADAAAVIFPQNIVTTSSGGSGAAAKTDWSWLTGRSVLIWPDADAAGRDFANDVAAILLALGAKVSVIDALVLAAINPAGGAREAPKKGWDAADAAGEWSDLVALRAAIHGLRTDMTERTMRDLASAREHDGLGQDMPFDVPSNVATCPEKKLRFPLIPLSEIVADTADLYAVKGLLPRTGLAIIWGPPKCGKSFWTLDVLMQLAMGRNYRGHRVKQGSVVYCVLEGQRGFKNRVVAIKQENDTPGDTPFQIMQAPLKLISDHEAFISEICNQFGAGCKPAVVCIDTLNRSIEGSESDDEAMGAYLAAAEAIRNAFGCLVIIVHHCGHDGTRPRGHSSLGGALDVQIAVSKSAGDVIVAELELAKDLETGLRIASRLAIVEIGRDGDGDPVTSCVLEPADVPKATAGRPPKAGRAAFDALKTAIDAHGEIAPGSSTIPPGVRVVRVETWRRYAHQSGISASSEPDALKKAFNRAHKKLIEDKYVGAWGEFRWIAT